MRTPSSRCVTQLSRRPFLFGLAASGTLGACTIGTGSSTAAIIDARADATMDELYRRFPETATLGERAVGTLIMPLVTKGGIGVGGGYGEGVLRINNVPVDYYRVSSLSGGFQFGVQQHTQVIFFLTQSALDEFRFSNGWAAGANAELITPEGGETLAADTTTTLSPVVAVIFGQAGLRASATLEGVKYTRFFP